MHLRGSIRNLLGEGAAQGEASSSKEISEEESQWQQHDSANCFEAANTSREDNVAYGKSESCISKLNVHIITFQSGNRVSGFLDGSLGQRMIFYPMPG